MGNQCSFVSPQLTTAVDGAAPTFAFDATNSNYFALRGQIATSNDAACLYPTESAFTPVLIDGTATKTCSILSGSSTYTAINCPTLINSQFTAGTYQLAFQGLENFSYGIFTQTITNRVFQIALPTAVTVFDAATATSTVTVMPTASISGTISDIASPSSSSSGTDSSSLSSSSDISSSASSSATASSSGISTVGSASSVQSLSASSSTPSSSASSSLELTSTSSSVSVFSSTLSSSASVSSSTSTDSSSDASSSSSINSLSSPSSSSSLSQTSLSSSFSSSSTAASLSSSKAISSSSTRLSTLTTLATRTSSSASSIPLLKVSPDATCGKKTGYTCKGSKFGDCCSQNGWCGRTTDYCAKGCLNSFGTCSASALSSSTPPSSARSFSTRSSAAAVSPSASSVSGLKVSTDGSCGGKTTCQGSEYGNCCSKYFYCGSSSNYCDAGCNPLFGTCKTQSISSKIPSMPTLKVSRDAKCGGSTGQTCASSAFGNCCSKYGWCGSASSHCDTGCQSGFGNCSSSQRLAIRDTDHRVEARATSVVQVPGTGAGPDYTYPPIPTVTVYAATLYVTVTVANTPVSESSIGASSVALSASQSQILISLTPTSSAMDVSFGSSATVVVPSSPTSDAITSVSVSLTISDSSATSSMNGAPPVATPSFCLKVVTPGTFVSGWAIKQNNPESNNGAFWIDPVVGGVHPAVSYFSISDQDTLTVVTPGTVGTIVTGYSRGTSNMFRFTTPYESLLATTCKIKTDVAGYVGQQILKCTGGFASRPQHTYTGFRPGTVNNNGLNYLFGTDDFVTDTPTNFIVDFGVFTGDDCGRDSNVSSAVSAVPTPSTSSAIQTSIDISTTSTVSSASLSSTSVVLSSSVVVSSSIVAPSPAPIPSNFCLKVARPGVRSTGWIVRQSNLDNGVYYLEPTVGTSNPYTSLFTLDDVNQLISTTPGIIPGTRAGYTPSTGSRMRFWKPLTDYLGVICAVKTDVPDYEGQQLLKCTGGFFGNVYTGWRHYTILGSSGERIGLLQGTDDLMTTNDTDDNFLVEMGLFTGGDCPVGDAPATASSELLNVTVLSSSVPTQSADVVFSSAVTFVGSSTPAPI